MSAPTSRHILSNEVRRLGGVKRTAAHFGTTSCVSAGSSRPATASSAGDPPLPSSLSSRRRSAHHAASASPLPYPSSPPPPPPRPTPASLRRDPHPETIESDPAWEEDLTADFAVSLQSSLARDWARAEKDRSEQLHPKWDEDAKRLEREGEEEGEGLFVGETIEGDGTLFEAVGEQQEEWVDWKSLLADVEPKKATKAKPSQPPKTALAQAQRAIGDPSPHTSATSKVDKPVPTVLPVSSHPTTPSLSSSPSPPPIRANPRRSAGPVLLRPVERLTSASLAPYAPPPLPRPSSPAQGVTEPHFSPLLNRHDWRLSSPLRRYLRSTPPSLFSPSETATLPLGHGRLLGVGTEAARIGWVSKVREEEQWGWKVRVPEAKERGEWRAADAYVKRMDRLLTLSRAADETAYQSSLSRSGSPAEREEKGITVQRALGVWLSDVSDLTAVGRDEGEGVRRKKEGGEEAAQKVVAEWRREDEGDLDEESGYKLGEGTILRFTRARSIVSSDANGPSATTASSEPKRPQPPSQGVAQTAAAGKGQTSDWFVQGTVLEVREGRLVVAFEKEDVWEMGDEAYQIDIGLDGSSYSLQEAALQNLYLDPARQRDHNAAQVEKGQLTYLQGGVAPGLREWTLQGTEVREVIVPAPDGEKTHPAPPVEEDGDDDLDLEALSPYANPSTPVAHTSMSISNSTSNSTSLHPSPLLRSNQLINSWIARYSRPGPPLAMPGDPDLGLNESQIRAIAMALGERVSLIQGPPGTGKSQTIVSLIALLKLHFRVPFPILLAAPTHVSVDHLLSLLVRAGLNPLRCGKAGKVSTPEAEKWTIERRQEQHPLWVRMEKAREESEDARREVLELREAMVSGEVEQQKSESDKLSDVVQAEERYRKAWRRFVMLEQKLYASLLATADVFCATALGSGASKVLSMVDFPLVLLDEAAMCTEPVSLIPLMKGAQHTTLIGDHKQLPAVVTSQEAKNERLHISLFERLLASSSVKSTLLDTQYRMRPSISAFPNLSFYNSALRDASVVSQRPPAPKSRFFAAPSPALTSRPAATAKAAAHSFTSASPGDFLPVSFVSHAGEERQHRQSILNRSEADLLVEIVGDLLHRNPTLAAADIGIISPYYAQTRLLINTFESGFASSRLRKLLGAKRAAEAAEVEVNTVDGFQGREKRVVLLSTVRSNRGGYIGFLTDRRRLNVALTRARDALIVVGNKETLRRAAANEWATPADPDADTGVWSRFLRWCEVRGLVKEHSAVGEEKSAV
ncbi:hypothetical protein JCM11251_005722 [Rhodosporidiobolus azoricus]